MSMTKAERQARERAIPRCSVAGCRQGRTMRSDMCVATTSVTTTPT